MNYSNTIFDIEKQFLSRYATFSTKTKGRAKQIPKDELRTEFSRDRDRILHSKSFRRLKHKTQVFLSPEGDHYRTRLTHTIEVSQIARAIARGLRLNEDLSEAISLGHDLGHTPFGHAGETALGEFTKFDHALQGLRVVDHLENDGRGLNLTFEVRNGIKNHSSNGKPSTLEGSVVAWADRIAYINHDIDDAIRAGVLDKNSIPNKFIKLFGDTQSKRINTMILDIIKNSFDKNFVEPSDKIKTEILKLRKFMFSNVYRGEAAQREEKKAIDMLRFLFDYFYKNLDKIPKYILDLNSTKEQKVCDYISMMTDRFAVATFTNLSIPNNWSLA